MMEEERIGNAACSFTVIEVVPVGRCPTGCERVCSIFDARFGSAVTWLHRLMMTSVTCRHYRPHCSIYLVTRSQ